ncbi:GNAT family N-acetyltransferase [Candidatus Uabimicrobium sp. HlEnr_7]|uniref:GNAT family N-acetyltransferase n=1 Tax=Candidatus Uabimicrobium helgolandensis TaxID=3095367 RepID=UPI003555E818
MSELVTKRLCLRRYVSDDITNFVALNTDPVVREKMDGAKSLKEAQNFFRKLLVSEELCWAIISGDNYIGHCFLSSTDLPNVLELGFLLHQKYWGQGFATEAAQVLVDYARNSDRVREIIATVDEDNFASICVLKKIGLQLKAIEKDEEGEYCLYSLCC